MDREQLCESLIIWLQTFNIRSPCETAGELAGGMAMAEALNSIAPNFFDVSWMSKIKDVGDNWRLKASNLKKILKGILDYYSEVLGQQIHGFQMPDINMIAEYNETVELGRLLQLILGCAVNCDTKQEYIERIMKMEESVQHVVMQAIQELMKKERADCVESSSEMAEQLKKSADELAMMSEQKEDMAQRCHELDLQVTGLQEERASLMAENDRLNERINAADSLEDLSTPAGRRYQQLQTQVDQQQEELYRLEAARDDLRLKVELQDKEILESQQKLEELSGSAEEARTLRDEMDNLRFTCDKVAKYELQIETYKKKMEEMSDLKGQVKILEERNTTLMQTSMEMEEKVRKMQPLKAQLEAYKKQVKEMQLKSSEETKRADKAEFEKKRSAERLQGIQAENERLRTEIDQMRESLDGVMMTDPGISTMSLVGDSLTSLYTAPLSSLSYDASRSDKVGSGLDSTDLDLIELPPQARERIVRLEHENKMLRQQEAENASEQSQLLQTLLDDANTRKNELETENRIANQRVLELEAQIEDFQEKQANITTAASKRDTTSELKAQLAAAAKQSSTLQAEVTRQQQSSDLSQTQLINSQEKVRALQEQLSRKDEEMVMMEERYKRYLEKAKSVIRSLDPKHNPGTAPEVQALKNQLQEKEKLIHHLEKDHDKAKTIRENEEKLIVTAWYNLGMQLHRRAADERLANSGSGQSFLARQRVAHTRRTQSISSHNSTPR